MTCIRRILQHLTPSTLMAELPGSARGFTSTSYSLAQAQPATTSSEEPPSNPLKRGTALFHRHMAARAVWRREMHALLTRWRAELMQNHREKQRHKHLLHTAALAQQTSERQKLVQQQQLQRAEEELRKACLEYEQANIKLSRAKLQAVKEARVQRTQRKRVARLLEASRHWVAPEELEQRIHQALDQPLPFGFVEPLITRQHQRL
ncbi:hypothetical protein V8C86DRAFT_2489023 [Haematococcus lacustris]